MAVCQVNFLEPRGEARTPTATSGVWELVKTPTRRPAAARVAGFPLVTQLGRAAMAGPQTGLCILPLLLGGRAGPRQDRVGTSELRSQLILRRVAQVAGAARPG